MLFNTETQEYMVLMALGVVFGIVNSPYNVGLSIIIGEMLPVEKVAASFGKFALVQGLGCIVGPVVAGLIYDTTKDHKLILYLAATGFFIGAVTTWLSSFLYKKRSKKEVEESSDV